MGLELYPSQEGSMLTAQNVALELQIEDCKRAETALVCFAEDLSLSGKAHDSAKQMASGVAIPAIRGLAVLCSACMKSNTQVSQTLSQYPWAGEGRLSEDELQQESQGLKDNAMRLAQVSKAPLTDNLMRSILRLDNAVQERISQMHAYNGATAGLYTQGQNIQEISLGVIGALSAFESISFNSETMTYSFSEVDYSFKEKLSDLRSLVGEAERTAIDFYHSLPRDLREALSIADIGGTKDGFALCKKPLDQVLSSMGISDYDETFFESLYLFGLRGSEGRFEHSVIRMVLPGQSSDAVAISVPFRSFDISVFEGDSVKNPSLFKDEINKIMDSRSKYQTSEEYLKYFADPSSEGSYLIADIAVERALEIANITHEGTWSPGTIATILKGDPYTSKVLNQLESSGIVDLESGTVAISDAAHLTDDEKKAILACITSSPDCYAYAAENQFHADLFINKDNTLFLSDYIGPRAIISDAGPGESISFYEAAFKYSQKDQLELENIDDQAKSTAFSVFNSGISYYDQQVSAHAVKGIGGSIVHDRGGTGLGGGGGAR